MCLSFHEGLIGRVILLFLAALLLASLQACDSPFDEPPLHDAAMRGDLDRVKKLVKEGVKVDSRNNEGATPLHWAAFKGHADVCEWLLTHGADVNALTKKGSTALRLATTHKQEQAIKVLKRFGAR